MEISLAPDILFYIVNVPITSTVLTVLIVFALIIILTLSLHAKLSYKTPGKLQLVFEMLMEGLSNMIGDVMPKKHAKDLLAFLMAFFILVIFSNWFGLLPIVPSLSVEKESQHTDEITTEVHAEDIEAEAEHLSNQDDADLEHNDTFDLGACLKSKHCYLTLDGIKEFHSSSHILRAPSSDLSMAVTLAVVSVVMTNVIGFKTLKFSYFKKYLNFSSGINFFVGILEIVSEFGKIISFSFRLFGNVFAGEVLLSVITSISWGVATLPFMVLEIFVGFIQAFVFFILTAVFIGLAVSQHH